MIWPLLLLLIAACLRFWRLDVLPPGMISDIATNGLDIQGVLAGHWHIFFPANNGREAFFIYFQSMLVAGVGNSVFTYAYSALVMGMLTVALAYRLLRAMFGLHVAWLGALLLASSFWMVAMSRVGLRTVSLPPFVLLTLYCLGQLLRSGRRRYVWLCGIALGAALYTYISARLLPILVVLLCLAEWRLARKRWRELSLVALMALIVFAPEGLYFLTHPSDFVSRAEEVSVFNTQPQIEGSFRTPAQSLIDTAGMFFIHGDSNQRYNIPGRPLFDPLLGALFAAGLAASLWLSRRDVRYRWLLLWLVVMLLPSALSHESPDTFRVLAAAPAIFALPALGLSWILGRVHQRTILWLTACLVGAWSLGWTAYLYFGQWAHDPRTYDAYAGGVTKLASYIAQRREPNLMFAYHDRWPVELLTPRTLSGQWFPQDSAAVALPAAPDADTLYVANPAAAWSRLDAATLPGLIPLSHPTAPSGVPDWNAFRWPAAAERQFLDAQQPLDVDMAPDVRLIGCSVVQQNDALQLRLIWQPERFSGPYDLYVHVLDASGKQVAQSDVLARPPEDGPASGYLLLTQHPLPAVPQASIALAGAAHRSAAHPEQVTGGPIGQEARLTLTLGARPTCLS